MIPVINLLITIECDLWLNDSKIHIAIAVSLLLSCNVNRLIRYPTILAWGGVKDALETKDKLTHN